MHLYNGRPRSFADLFPQAGQDAREILEHVEVLLGNAVTSRAKLLSKLTDERRDIDAECGYPGSPVPAQKYQGLYERDAIAARVVQVYPKECWQVQPTLYNDENPAQHTAFEDAWQALGKGLRGEPSYQRGEKGSPIWEYLKRADELSGIGRYGIILLGVDDTRDYASPLRPQRGRKLLFLRCLPETLAQITQYETDRYNPRYGQPVQYLVTMTDPRHAGTGTGTDTTSINVHWSRVVHIADNLDTSEVFGEPRMAAVLNRILDLQKLYGGSAEMYWKGALPGISLETHPQLGGDVRIDREAVRGEIEQYMNGLQRYMALTGLTAKSLAPQVVDPSSQINTQIEAICIRLGVPKRVFMGSERGELASSQDDAAWNDRLRERQNNYLTPRLIVPFVDRLINIGVLPEPEGGYVVAWPDLTSQSEEERATVAFKSAQALAQYVTAGVESLVPALEFLTHFMGMPEAEAQSIIKKRDKTAGANNAPVQQGAGTHNPAGIPGGVRGTPRPVAGSRNGSADS